MKEKNMVDLVDLKVLNGRTIFDSSIYLQLCEMSKYTTICFIASSVPRINGIYYSRKTMII